jgi:SAM-dependent methyltransferase
MRSDLLHLLRCSTCRGAFDDLSRDSRTGDGRLRCRGCGNEIPIVRGIPRFVPAENYAESFGLQWNRFRQTQLDSHSGTTISRDRFLAYTHWSATDLAGKLVLDVGCGAGRFAEVALSLGARVVAVDYSSAVDACLANLGQSHRLAVVQADLYSLPFAPGTFDFVYCLGVLQHTPDVARSVRALAEQLRDGGRLAVDLYPKLWRNLLWPKYWLRPLTSRIPPRSLMPFVERWVDALLPVSRALGRLPRVGRQLRYAIPVANYEGIYPLSPAQLHEWAVLDTYDMLAPTHDHPQTASTLRRWMTESALDDVVVERRGFLIGRGTRPERNTGAVSSP